VSGERNLYDFFLDARRSLVTLWQDQLPLSELRQIAEERVAERTSGGLPIQYLGERLPRGSLTSIPELVLDPTLARALGRCEPVLEGLTEHKAVAAFFPPQFGIMSFFLQEGQEEPGFSLEDFSTLRTALQPQQQLVRSGFLSSEFDVLESAAFGFHGVTIHARHLDHFQIQYLTELCRDFKMSAVVVVDSEATLARVLETDAPYLGAWGYTARDLTRDFSIFDRLSRKFPSTCVSFAFYPNVTDSDRQLMQGLGFRAVFC
jgi:hypothetical protein